MKSKNPCETLFALDTMIRLAGDYLAENEQCISVNRLRDIFQAIEVCRDRCSRSFASGENADAIESAIRLMKKLARFYRIAEL